MTKTTSQAPEVTTGNDVVNETNTTEDNNTSLEGQTTQVDEEELKRKRASWQGLYNSLERNIFANKAATGLIDSFIKDFTPVPVKDQPGASKAPGISLRSVGKALWFGLRHPRSLFRIVRAARNGTFTDPDFQRDLLARDKTWEFVGKISERLPQIGKVLDGFQIGGGLFSPENGVLSTKGLEALKGGLTDPKVLQAFKGVTLATLSPTPDWTKVISGGLGILANNASFKQFFNERGGAIRDYVKSLAETNETVRNSIKDYKVDSKFLDQIPAILNNFPQLQGVWESMQKDGVMIGVEKALDMLAEDASLHAFFKENPSFLPDIARGVIEATPSLSEMAAGYKLEGQVLDIVGHVVTDTRLAGDLVKLSNKGDYIKLTEVLIDALNNPELKIRDELQRQAREGLFDKLIAGVIEQNDKATAEAKKENPDAQSLREMLEDFGIKAEDVPKIAEFFPIMLDSPKELATIFGQFQKGQYKEMLSSLSDMSASNPGIAEYMKRNGALFEKIILKSVGVPDLLQDPKMLSAQLPEGKEQSHIADIFNILMKGENKKKIEEIYALYEKGEWVSLIKNLCQLMETDVHFKEYMTVNMDKFALIINTVVNQSPDIKKWTVGADVGSLAAAILKDPGSIKVLMEGLEKGGTATAMAAAKVMMTKALDREFRKAFGGVVYNAVSGWIVGGGSEKQALVNGLLTAISSRGDKETQVKLADLLSGDFEGIGIDPKQKEAAIKLLASSTLFDDVKIGDGKTTLNLENLKIKGTTFVNSTLNNVSFKDSVLTNISFLGASFSNVDFKGATLDKNTFMSMLGHIRKIEAMSIKPEGGQMSFEGVKIVGDLSGLDLSGISLAGADMSGVTSMKGANISGLDLSNVKIKNELLMEVYNLSKAKGVSLGEEVVSKQKEKVIEAAVFAADGKLAVNKEYNQSMILEIKRLLAAESEIGERVREMLESNPQDIANKNFPMKPEGLKHAADYRTSTSRLLTAIHNSDANADNLSRILTAQIIADKVSAKLFGEGHNRGQDFALIDEMMQTVISDFTSKNPGIKPESLLEDPKLQEFIDSTAKAIEKHSHYTALGKISGGIYITKQDLTPELMGKVLRKMDAGLGEDKLSEVEIEAVKDIAGLIGKNLFGKGMSEARKIEVAAINESLTEAFTQMKKDFGPDYISEVLKDPKALVGSVDGEFRTGLTGFYYGMSNYTAMGAVVGGGIQLDKEKLSGPDFISALEENIERASRLSHKEHSAIEHITHGIGENLFGEGGVSSRVKDTGRIHTLLLKVFAGIKAEKNGADLSEVIRDNADSIIGKVDKGWVRTDRTGLTDLFYKNASYTTAGLASGGIYLKEDVVNGLWPHIKEAMDREVGSKIASEGSSQKTAINSRLLSEAKDLAQTVGVTSGKSSDQSLEIDSLPLDAMAKKVGSKVDVVTEKPREQSREGEALSLDDAAKKVVSKVEVLDDASYSKALVRESKGGKKEREA